MFFIKKLKETSTFDADTLIAALNENIREFCREHPTARGKNEEMMTFLLRRTDMSALKNVVGGHGGPFGALLVDFNTTDAIPVVVGFGTNHVVPNNDPSAHAEMTAIRDTAKRLGRGDMSGLTLVTSCECCPMCLSAALGCKVDDIYYAATQNQAAKVGFSDADQYRLMKAGGIECHAQQTKDMDGAEK